MAVTTGPQIDLNQIHVEVGGGSGTQASQNDADIRGLIGKGSGVQSALSEWYGASSEWTTAMTNGNPQGGAPGTTSGFAVINSLTNASNQTMPSVNLGSMANRGGAIPPSNGVGEWVCSVFSRVQAYGTHTTYFGFRDSTKTDGVHNSPNYTPYAWPAGDIILAKDANFTTSVVTIPKALLNHIDTANAAKGCQVGWSFSQSPSSTNPTYNEVLYHFLDAGTVYVKVESS